MVGGLYIVLLGNTQCNRMQEAMEKRLLAWSWRNKKQLLQFQQHKINPVLEEWCDKLKLSALHKSGK
jgi:hypothetical protein